MSDDPNVVGEPAKTKTGEQAPPIVSRQDAPAYSSNIPGPVDPEKAWHEHAAEAVQALYPHMRRGVDYEWGRPADDPTGEPRMLHWDERFAPADQGKVQELAKKLADRDPYLNYKAQPSLHQGQLPEGATLPPDVAQSEVNPSTDDKEPTQPYTEGETPAEAESEEEPA